ncbi:MAG TPA: hypothetical protein ENG23_00555 [Methanomicrobia archaeon]|nr:hypothetical protein [Methanomicrobia archaeon]
MRWNRLANIEERLEKWDSLFQELSVFANEFIPNLQSSYEVLSRKVEKLERDLVASAEEKREWQEQALEQAQGQGQGQGQEELLNEFGELKEKTAGEVRALKLKLEALENQVSFKNLERSVRGASGEEGERGSVEGLQELQEIKATLGEVSEMVQKNTDSIAKLAAEVQNLSSTPSTATRRVAVRKEGKVKSPRIL